jgi:hypothetical protein
VKVLEMPAEQLDFSISGIIFINFIDQLCKQNYERKISCFENVRKIFGDIPNALGTVF